MCVCDCGRNVRVYVCGFLKARSGHHVQIRRPPQRYGHYSGALLGGDGHFRAFLFPSFLRHRPIPSLTQVTSVAFSRDSAFALTGSWDRCAILWDVATGTPLHRLTGEFMFWGCRKGNVTPHKVAGKGFFLLLRVRASPV